MREQNEHFQELMDYWQRIHDRIGAGKATAIEIRELVVELMAFCMNHWNHPDAKWITEQALADLNRWLVDHIENDEPEKTGLKAHRVAWFDLVRYWLVRDLVDAGVVSRKRGKSSMVAFRFAVAYLKHFDLPAGRGYGGTGRFVGARAIKDSFEKVDKQGDDHLGRWNLPNDDQRITVTAAGIAAVEQANPNVRIE